MYENLMRGGVVNASGEAPLLVAREKAPKKSGHLMLTFQIVGVPLEKMKDMSSVIAACIGMHHHHYHRGRHHCYGRGRRCGQRDAGRSRKR